MLEAEAEVLVLPVQMVLQTLREMVEMELLQQ